MNCIYLPHPLKVKWSILLLLTPMKEIVEELDLAIVMSFAHNGLDLKLQDIPWYDRRIRI